MLEANDMSEKLHNDEFEVVRVDGNALTGDSNKIKLKLVSYAAILEVQEAYIAEEIERMEAQENKLEAAATNEDLTASEKQQVDEVLADLQEKIDVLYNVYDEFSESHKRFVEDSKKGLKLHDDNLEEMKKRGHDLEPVDISSFTKAQEVLEDAKEDDLFSNIDNEAIKKEVERVMSEKEDEVGSYDVTSDNFENVVSTVASEVEENLKEEDAVTKEDVSNLVDSQSSLSDEETIADTLGATKMEPDLTKDSVGDFLNSFDSKKEEETTIFGSSGSIFDDTGTTTSVGNIDDKSKDEVPNIDDFLRSFAVGSNPTKDEKKDKDDLSLGNGSSKTISFAGDNDFTKYVAELGKKFEAEQKEVDELETSVRGLKSTVESKKKKLSEAEERSKKQTADMALMRSQLDEVKRISEERKALFEKKQALQGEVASLSGEIANYDTETKKYEDKAASDLATYQDMKEELKKYLSGDFESSTSYTTEGRTK